MYTDELIYIGTIKNAKGTMGEIEIIDFPQGLLKVRDASILHIGYTESFTDSFKLTKFKLVANKLIIKLYGLNTPEKVLALRGNAIYAKKSDVTFDETSYKIEDLLKCNVYNTDSGELLGRLVDVMLLPANDVWVVQTLKGELPVPVINEVIKKVDIQNCRIEIVIIDGLLSLTDTKKEEEDEYFADEN